MSAWLQPENSFIVKYTSQSFESLNFVAQTLNRLFHFFILKDAAEIDQLISYLINKEESEGVVLLGHSTGCQVSTIGLQSWPLNLCQIYPHEHILQIILFSVAFS